MINREMSRGWSCLARLMYAVLKRRMESMRKQHGPLLNKRAVARLGRVV